jgi:hypothetical protein
MELIRGTARETRRNPGAYTIRDYLSLVRSYFLDGGRVQALYGHERALATPIKPVMGGARATR